MWRFADATREQPSIETGAHLAIRTGSSTSQKYADTDTLDGWTDNFVERPEWYDDPEMGNMRLDGSNSFADPDEGWFDASMPFTAALSQAWEP